VFARPGQHTVRAVVGIQRGIPDVAMSAAHDGAWVYYSYNPARAGWRVFGGTSEATPIFAGIVALADQFAGRRLGDIDRALYTLGAADAERSGIVDVTTGGNTFAAVTGYPATSQGDVVSEAPVAQVAERAGHTVEVLLKVYAKGLARYGR